MKKIMSCILICMLLISIFMTDTNAASFEEELAEKFNNYCINFVGGADSAVDPKVKIYEYVKDDNIVYFSAVCCWLAPGAMGWSKVYGGWEIYSPAANYPSVLSFYVMIGDEIYRIEDAWEQGLVTDLTPAEGFSKYTVVTRIDETQSTEPTSETQMTEPATEPSAATEPTEASTSAPAPKINKTKASVKAGGTVTLKVADGTVKSWTTSNRKVATVSKGKVTGLKKGSAIITATTTTGKKLTCKMTVTTSPKLSKKSVTVKKGKTVSVKITGKAKTVKNVYTNTKHAKIISKNTAATIKVKGLKKGKTTLKVKVNGVVLKLKVKVK